jgi:hypothetical protein
VSEAFEGYEQQGAWGDGVYMCICVYVYMCKCVIYVMCYMYVGLYVKCVWVYMLYVNSVE